MMRIPSHASMANLAKLPAEVPDTPCIDDNGLPSYLDENGQCVMAKCPGGTAACGGWCVGCGPNATINLGDCGCDCLPGFVPVDLETPGIGCMPAPDDYVVYYDASAPAARPPGGIAPPVAQGGPPGSDTGNAIGSGVADAGDDLDKFVIGAGVVAAGVALLIWRPWK